MFEATVNEGVLRLERPGTRWLSTGPDGGCSTGPTAYNISVPEGWDRTDLDAYVAERRARASFGEPGPALLTGVDLEHLRAAHVGPVEVYATAGVSNPAALPIGTAGAAPATRDEPDTDDCPTERTDAGPGTVNLIVGTSRALPPGTLANLLTVATEAKTATLIAETGFSGTTTDAVVVGCDPDGEPAPFSGSATPVGAATRACVREAVRASLASRYAERELPATVADAEYGVVTDERATVVEIKGNAG